MLSKTFRIMLSLTSVSPIFISLAYVEFFREHHIWKGATFTLTFPGIFCFAKFVVGKAKQSLERLPISIKKAKSTDKEVIGFCASYALPIIFRSESASDIQSWILASAILISVLITTNAMPINPILGLLGYHFYEVDSDSGIGYVLITKKHITNVSQINAVVQISEYGILEA